MILHFCDPDLRPKVTNISIGSSQYSKQLYSKNYVQINTSVCLEVCSLTDVHTGKLNIDITSLQARSADLPASPAGLLGRFAPSGFALASRSRAIRASR